MRKTVNNSLILYLFLCIFLTTAICSCVNKEINQPNSFLEKWQDKAKKSAPHLQQRKVFNEKDWSSNATTSTDNQNIWQKTTSISPSIMSQLSTQKISVRFIGDSLPVVLRTMARLANENIMISPDIEGILDTHIENTPWNVVFMGIIDSYGLVVTKEDNLLHVLSNKDMEQQLAKKILNRQEEEIAPLVTKLVSIEYSKPADIAASITRLLSKDIKGNIRGSVSIDNHSRSIIINDNKENMHKLLNLVYQLDKPTPQILIKAYIIEATKDTARELGVKWGSSEVNTQNITSKTVSSLNNTATTIESITETIPINSTAPNGFNLSSAGDFSTPGAVLNVLNIVAQAGSDNLDIQLSALQEDGKINILSSPSIATLDNNKATIESGTSIPYPKGTDLNGNIIYGKANATLKLIVTPHVIANTLIKLEIKASKDEVDTSRSVNGVPFILTKNAETNLIVPNNHTVVIAGLTKEVSSSANSGVPILKDIPILGHLFKSDTSSNKFEDLLIFITPTILNQPQ